MATDIQEGEELVAILEAVRTYNLKSADENRLTRLTLLLAIGDDEPVALLEGPPVKTTQIDPRQLH